MTTPNTVPNSNDPDEIRREELLAALGRRRWCARRTQLPHYARLAVCGQPDG